MSSEVIESDDDLVLLLQCEELAEAELLRGLFEADGLFVNLSGAHHKSVMSFAGPDIQVGIWVRRGDEARARELLAQRDAEALSLDAEPPPPAEGEAGVEYEEGLPDSEETLEARARRRRSRRKLAAWTLLAGPLLLFGGVAAIPVVRHSLRVDWYRLDTSQLEARFPLAPYHSSPYGERLRTDHYQSAQLRSRCMFDLVVKETAPLDQAGAAAWFDAAAEQLENGMAAPFAHGMDETLQGHAARRLDTQGQVGGEDVTARVRWVAGAKGVAVQSVVCPRGEFAEGDAKAFFDSLKIRAL
jgi:hypothetical protein